MQNCTAVLLALATFASAAQAESECADHHVETMENSHYKGGC